MRTINLAGDGVPVTQLALGTMYLGTRADQRDSWALLDQYTADGGTFLDTSNAYASWEERGTTGGHSERMIGSWLRAHGGRDTLFIATKGAARWTRPDHVWPDDSEYPINDRVPGQLSGASASMLRSEVAGSLDRLGTDYIDLYFIHADDRATPLEETLGALAALVDDGLIRHYGWSNVHTWRLATIRQLCERHGWPQPVAVQQEGTLLKPRGGVDTGPHVDSELLDYIRAHGDMGLVCYSPLLQGYYDLPPDERASHWKHGTYRGEDNAARLDAVARVAKNHGATPGQVVLAWMLAQTSPVRVPLLGTTRLDRYTELRESESLRLSPEDLAALDGP